MFVKGNYFVEIAANPEGDHNRRIAGVAGGSRSHHHRQHRFAGSARLVSRRGPAVAAPGARKRPWHTPAQARLRGAIRFRKAFVAYETSPDSASAIMQKLRARFGRSAAANLADDAFQATDQYLGRLFIFRKGRLIGGYSIKAEGHDPAALAAALAAQVR